MAPNLGSSFCSLRVFSPSLGQCQQDGGFSNSQGAQINSIYCIRVNIYIFLGKTRQDVKRPTNWDVYSLFIGFSYL